MADLSSVYTLTGTGSVAFNSGILGNGSVDNLYWISTIHGLDGPALRVPVDDVPFGDGGLVHASWMGPRRPILEGNLIVQSVSLGSGACQEVLNGMEDALNDVLSSIIAPNAGSLAWTPAGGAAQSLAVYYEVSLDIQPTDNYRLRSFSFGLVSPAADPS